uniref:BEN domain-containing protein n=1 Tax=Ditylenchus dipsaci TaxID=166011 RepID=A0A915CRD4_9BILA
MEEEQHCQFLDEGIVSISKNGSHSYAKPSQMALNDCCGDTANSTDNWNGEPRQFFLLSNVHHPSLGDDLTTTSQTSEDVLSTHQRNGSTYFRYQQNIPLVSSLSSSSHHQLPVSNTPVRPVQHRQSFSNDDTRISSSSTFMLDSQDSQSSSKTVRQRHEVRDLKNSNYPLFDQMADAVLKMQKCSEDVVEAYPHDERLVDFVQSTSHFAQIVQSTFGQLQSLTQELNTKMVNQTTVVNGMLLRRGAGSGVGVVHLNSHDNSSASTAGTDDKIVFDLSRCDHGRQTIYDNSDSLEFGQKPVASKTVDMLKIFEKYFTSDKAPKWQNAEELATILTEFVLNTIYFDQTEKWTYCVRYSSRNGHKTVPHGLIEEIKTQVAKGFGVYGSETDNLLNLAIGSAVVNKATRFFNAKRRVSTRATLRKLACHYSNSQNGADTASNKSCSSVDIEIDQNSEEAINPSIAETIDAVINNLTSNLGPNSGESKPKRGRRSVSVAQVFSIE